ncbi:MAG: AraC family transcriptional regulator [Rubritepida sp.]|nr:AraC family transcriptional regulator [Rubritepida sp.]
MKTGAMPFDLHATDPSILKMFQIVQARFAEELDGSSRVSERVVASNRVYRYQLRDSALWRSKFVKPIFRLATRTAGSILTSYADSRFATEVFVDGDEGDLFCFTTMLRGEMTLVRNGDAATGTMAHGLAWRPGPGTRLLIGDDTARANVFFKVTELEDALEHLLDERLRSPLEFVPVIDWSQGLAASLKCQLDLITCEFKRPDGMASNPVALASMTDLLISLALHGVPHNYSDRLDTGLAGALPAYILRAEEFMRVKSAEPIRMVQVAAAAGCSMRSLSAVFQQFRGKTPLGALHAIRLDQAHRDLSRGANSASVATVGRCYGFTNPARFTNAFRRRFGETPSEVVRRATRS